MFHVDESFECEDWFTIGIINEIDVLGNVLPVITMENSCITCTKRVFIT